MEDRAEETADGSQRLLLIRDDTVDQPMTICFKGVLVRIINKIQMHVVIQKDIIIISFKIYTGTNIPQGPSRPRRNFCKYPNAEQQIHHKHRSWILLPR